MDSKRRSTYAGVLIEVYILEKDEQNVNSEAEQGQGPHRAANKTSADSRTVGMKEKPQNE